MICKCGGTEVVSVNQTFKNGTVHIRLDCKDCGRFLKYDASVEDGDFVMPFGKHKGLFMKDLPEDYLRWIIGNDEFRDGNIKKRARRLLGLSDGNSDV